MESQFVALDTTVGAMREWSPRKQYITRWLDENLHLPGATKVRVTPWHVDVTEIPPLERMTRDDLALEFDSIVPDEGECKGLLDEAEEIARKEKEARERNTL